MSQAEDYVLSARGLVKEFGGFLAVNDVDLNVRRGSIHALIGPNGAGKTTCFHLLTKFHRPTKGQIVLNGRDITSLDPARVAQLGMVRSFQISAVFNTLSALENVRVALQRKSGSSFDFWRSENRLKSLNDKAYSLLQSVGLASHAHTRASLLPYGRKRALEVATTLALDPEVLLLDEPMAGMGHEDIGQMSALIKEVAKSRTILMVEHNLSVVSTLSNAITVLARGRVLAEGDYKTVSSHPKVMEAYIGAGHV